MAAEPTPSPEAMEAARVLLTARSGWWDDPGVEMRDIALAFDRFAAARVEAERADWHLLLERSDLSRVKERIDLRLNNALVEMEEGWDDSIVGFNAAWDIVRAIFAEEADRPHAAAT